MCGIAGEIRFDGEPCSPAVLEVMNEAMVSRGPDSSGVYTAHSAGLAHRRLSIIDLATRAHQPMHIPDLGLTTVFNGEIYNYRELKRELESLGHRFFSSSDTEVLTRAYSQWGEEAVSRFYGMFAFAIHHRDTGELFCARDRLGIKPFYYSVGPQSFRFSSSLPSLLKSGGMDTSIDPVALHYYMSFHAVVPAPHTLFNGIRKLPAAHTLRISPRGELKSRRYWDAQYLRDPEKSRWTERDWEEATLETLRKSVKRRLVADVPVGLFLSGGTDSSLIAALMAEIYGERLKSFSVGFKDAAGESGNEFKYSDIVSKHCHTDHYQIAVSTNELLDNLPHCISAMSEPMVSHDNIGFYLLSKHSAEQVKVVQSGQGADEVFAGYHWYPPMLKSSNAVEDYAKGFFDYSHDELKDVLEPRFWQKDHAKAFVDSYFASGGDLAPLDQALRLDTNIMLVDDPVKRVDNMTMAWGLEARVPFLDHDLVELVASMPAKLKIPDGGKYILKKIARRFVPPEVIDRPKGYFPVPQLKYIEGPFYDLVRDVLGGSRARQRGMFRTEYVEKLLADPKGNITRLGGSKLWQIALLEMWLQRNEV